jgi:hypothetical protein
VLPIIARTERVGGAGEAVSESAGAGALVMPTR